MASFRALRFVPAFVAASMLGTRAHAQCDSWRAGPFASITGMDGYVLAATMWDPDGAGSLPPQLVAAGNFTVAGGTVVNGIARWDGVAWQPFGSGFDGVAPNSFTAVRALAVLPASFGSLAGQLVAGGDFTTASGVTVNGVARWDGNAWQPVGGGVSNSNGRGFVYAMTVVPGSGAFAGELVVGGAFSTAGGVTVENIAHWNGTNWHSVGPGLEGYVYSLATWDPDGAGPLQPQVIAGGYFEWSGDHLSLLFNLGRWDGSAWRAFSVGTFPEQATGLDQSVNALASLPASVGSPLAGQLGVGGLFIGDANVSFPQEFGKFTTWDGTQWTRFAAGIDSYHAYDSVNALGVIPSGPTAGQLVAAGNFAAIGGTPSGGTPVNNVTRWDGTAWQPVGSGFDDYVYALTTWDPDGTGAQAPQLVAGGRFRLAGAALANSIAHFDGSAWQPFGQSSSAQVLALAQFGTAMVAGGTFSVGSATGSSPRNVIRWNGTTVYPMGSGFNGTVHALKSFNTTTLGVTLYHIVAGGEFTTAGGSAAFRIAEWTENPVGSIQPPAWTALGNGFSGNVFAIERFNNQVYAAGDFTASQNLSTSLGRIAFFNGTSWVQPGSGLNGTCYALKVYNGQLYAGGSFTTAGGLSSGGLARWNGTMWSIVGGNFSGTVFALEVFNGDLIIGGGYPGITGNPNIAKYNSVSGAYSALGSGGMDNLVRSLLTEHGDLYAGGLFLHAGGAAAPHLARWNGSAWSDVRGGTDGGVFALAGYNNELQVGGTFANVGTGVASPGWGRYLETGAPWLAAQALPVSIQCGDTATFSAVPADGFTPVSVTWRRNGALLNNDATGTGSTIEGANRPELTIFNAGLADQGNYVAVITNSCGSVTSPGASLTVYHCCGSADFNCDGDIGTDADIEAFFACLAGTCPPAPCPNSADFNDDGDIGTDADIEAFFRVLAGGTC